MERLLAARIKAIFVVCGQPNIAIHQSPLLLEKWNKLIVGLKQIILGLIVNTNKMTVGITDEYIQQIWDLLNLWDPNCRLFKVNNMQKLIRMLARLEEGVPWVFKLMSHLYTSLAYALKNNTELLKKGSSGFRELCDQISTKNLSGKQSNHQCHINFAMKKVAKMISKHGHLYLENSTMQDELNFFSKALLLDFGIKLEMPIAHLFPRTTTALIIGDSSLFVCGGGGLSITLEFWWHLSFLIEVVKRTLLHLKNDSDKSFISINCLEFVPIILNYCTSLVDDPHPVVLYVKDNTSALNWTLHMSKILMIGRARASFLWSFDWIKH
jgi:hypothetical protein